MFALHRERPAAGSVVGRHIRTVLLGMSEGIEQAIDQTLSQQTLADVARTLQQHERARVRRSRPSARNRARPSVDTVCFNRLIGIGPSGFDGCREQAK